MAALLGHHFGQSVGVRQGSARGSQRVRCELGAGIGQSARKPDNSEERAQPGRDMMSEVGILPRSGRGQPAATAFAEEVHLD
jgi:hypothetical protein